jgi:Ser/Thr protein kinase RdoA (MazF antagonist)
MEKNMLEHILNAFEISTQVSTIKAFGNGLINNTWHVSNVDGNYILQRINHSIFKQPEDIAFNINNIGNYFIKKHPTYNFIQPIKTTDSKAIIHLKEQGYFRMFPFVQNSHTIDVVSNTQQAFEAAKQFGRFTNLLCDFNEKDLKTTLPDFHNLSLRYQQFEEALSNANVERIEKSMEAIQYLNEQRNIVSLYEVICTSPNFKKRVTHHDTKISNVLLDQNDKGLCVIDLDTVMSGYFISDVGDMMRTYLSPVSEEEKNFSKIKIREDYFKAIAEGYLGEMKSELSTVEIDHFIYAGKFMIYMQALRFLTDYLNDDIYYGAKYEGHNFIRAQNQIVLLQKYLEKENVFSTIIKKIIAK